MQERIAVLSGVVSPEKRAGLEWLRPACDDWERDLGFEQGASSVADGATAPSRGRGESGGAVQSLRRQGCKQLPPVRVRMAVARAIWLRTAQ